MKPRFSAGDYFFLFSILMIVLHFFLPEKFGIYLPYFYTGLILVILGLVLIIWAGLIFKTKKLPTQLDAELKELVITGPYRFSRNPTYLGMTMIFLGYFLWLGFWAALGPIAFWIVINCNIIPYEEQKLEAAFGKKYLDYKKIVRRWL